LSIVDISLSTPDSAGRFRSQQSLFFEESFRSFPTIGWCCAHTTAPIRKKKNCFFFLFPFHAPPSIKMHGLIFAFFLNKKLDYILSELDETNSPTTV
jgi:hypothetical protein